MWKKRKKKTPLFDKPTPKFSPSSLKSKLDRIFSQFIRLRDADNNGYVRCISCGKVRYWKDVDCGHFVNRSHMSLRFNEKNCNAQCQGCNRFDEGNNIGYTKGIIKKYGIGVIDELEVLKYQTTSFSEFDYQVMIKYYQDKVKQLKKEKGL
ncbi:MAG: recombinase [Odoribacter splanchnicus]|nr:recombinase [Odoribacter splanchnicus]